MNEQEFAELAAGFALHALSPSERSAFETARAEHPEWEHWISADLETAAALGEAVGDELPPLTMRSTLLARIPSLPQVPALDAATAASSEPGEPWQADPPRDDAPFVEPAPTTTTIQAVERRNWTRGLVALAASVVLLVVIGFGAASINEYVNRPPEAVALQQIEAASDARSETVALTEGGTATAHWSVSVGKAVLVSDGLPEIADDQAFEMWFVPAEGDPVSAGTFQAGPGGRSTALLDADLQPGDAIAVTVEDEGGSPDGAPTTDPIVVIPTA